MKCHTVRSKLAGYLDDAIMGAAQAAERARVREHLEGCGFCREELERYRKLSALLSQVPPNLPPADFAGQRIPPDDGAGHWRIFLRDSGVCAGAAIDCAGNYRAGGAERRAAEYSAAGRIDYAFRVSGVMGSGTA